MRFPGLLLVGARYGKGRKEEGREVEGENEGGREVEGENEGGKKGGRWREGGKEGGREGMREGGNEGGREGGGGREEARGPSGWRCVESREAIFENMLNSLGGNYSK